MSIVSRPYKPDPAFCCERCIFGTGEHAPDCELRQQPYVYGGRINGIYGAKKPMKEKISLA